MDDAGVRRVLLVRAFEEERGGTRFLSAAACEAAGREARVAAGRDAAAFLTARADRLMPGLRDAVPGVDALERAAGSRAPAPWIVAAIAFVFGLLVDRAGGGRFLNLLAFPLAGLVAWNLAVYLALAVAAFLPRREAEVRGEPRGALLSVAAWTAAPERPWSRTRRIGEWAGAAAHAQSFLTEWGRAAAPLHAARLRRALHVGAAALVAGAVAGMYVRGLVLEYRVGWESTFLDAEGVRRFLSVLLWPATALGVGAIPDVDGIAALRGAPEAGRTGAAAGWIHMYAVTAAVTVLAPRAILAWIEGRRARRLERNLPVRFDDEPWVLRLLAGDRGGDVEVRTILYAHRLDPRASEGLTAFALDLCGNRATRTDPESLEYGDEYAARAAERRERMELVVFNLAQTPEPEVHGEFCRGALANAAGSRGTRAVLVVVDESSFAERLGDGEEARERLESRRRTWTRVLRDVDVDGVFLDLSRHVSNEALARARAASWPGPLEASA